MKALNDFVLEKLKVAGNKHTYHPNSKDELVDLIIKEIETNGPECSLNHIDTSNITDMSYLFRGGNKNQYQGGHPVLGEFNGDISNWYVSNVENMRYMFYGSLFNGDISDWQINPKAKGNMHAMFRNSPLENTPPAWYNKYK